MRTKYASTRFSIVKRSKGQSAVDAASYISRSVLVSEYDGKTYRPKYHEDLVHCEINLPEYAPEEWLDRAVLWNSVELNEKQKNAQLCRTLKAALPNDWSYELAEETVRHSLQLPQLFPVPISPNFSHCSMQYHRTSLPFAASGYAP